MAALALDPSASRCGGPPAAADLPGAAAARVCRGTIGRGVFHALLVGEQARTAHMNGIEAWLIACSLVDALVLRRITRHQKGKFPCGLRCIRRRSSDEENVHAEIHAWRTRARSDEWAASYFSRCWYGTMSVYGTFFQLHTIHTATTPQHCHTTPLHLARTYTTPQILTNHRPRRAGVVCTLPSYPTAETGRGSPGTPASRDTSRRSSGCARRRRLSQRGPRRRAPG